jgi:hypothetical protein
MTTGEWQVKDVCWKGEPVCIACASAKGNILDSADSLEWHQKEASVWPHVFVQVEGAVAAVVQQQCDAGAVDDNRDDEVDKTASIPAVISENMSSGSYSDPPVFSRERSSPAHRAQNPSVLHRKGA